MSEEDEETVIRTVKTYKMKRYHPQACLQKLTHPIIRPPRFIYNPSILDPRRIYRGRYTFTTHYIPFPLSIYIPKNMRYMVLYLHGNSSSRYEGFLQLKNLPIDVGLACFDFNGCGLRLEKKFISLGKHQASEVDIAARFLKREGYQVIGWGRSMGAVSLLLSEQLTVLAVDSPFSSLNSLVKELGQTQLPCCGLIPFYRCLIPFIWCAASSHINDKTEMHPNQLQIIEKINTHPNRSILFLAGTQDTMIQSGHAQRLYDHFTGRKKIILFEGDHNSTRPSGVLIDSFLYLEKELQLSEGLENEETSIQKMSNQFAGSKVEVGEGDSVHGSQIRVTPFESNSRENLKLIVPQYREVRVASQSQPPSKNDIN